MLTLCRDDSVEELGFHDVVDFSKGQIFICSRLASFLDIKTQINSAAFSDDLHKSQSLSVLRISKNGANVGADFFISQ